MYWASLISWTLTLALAVFGGDTCATSGRRAKSLGETSVKISGPRLVAAAGAFLAITSNGTLVAWGGTIIETNVPIGLSNAIAVASGSKSRSFRFVPAIEDTEPAGDERPVNAGVPDAERKAPGRREGGGGRIERHTGAERSEDFHQALRPFDSRSGVLRQAAMSLAWSESFLTRRPRSDF